MKKFLSFVAIAFATLSAMAQNNFYVIMKDGSEQNSPTGATDSISFRNPESEQIMGFDDLKKKFDETETRIDSLATVLAIYDVSEPNTTPNPVLGEHEYVDLGLPSGTLWATTNIGAKSPEEYGSYFAWGATSTSSNYTGDYHNLYKVEYTILQERDVINSVNCLTENYDVATAKWGEDWRMPTLDELKELLSECKGAWVIRPTKGYEIVGPNGKTLFFPAAGSRSGKDLNDAGADGGYWTSSSCKNDRDAFYFYFYPGNKISSSITRYMGLTVRPVVKK